MSPEQIRLCRNSLKTKEIIIKLRSKLEVLLSDDHPPCGELMEKTINYINNFWTQLFAYLNDGSYSIDNSIAGVSRGLYNMIRKAKVMETVSSS